MWYSSTCTHAPGPALLLLSPADPVLVVPTALATPSTSLLVSALPLITAGSFDGCGVDPDGAGGGWSGAEMGAKVVAAALVAPAAPAGAAAGAAAPAPAPAPASLVVAMVAEQKQ